MNSLMMGCADPGKMATNSKVRTAESGFKNIGYVISDGEL